MPPAQEIDKGPGAMRLSLIAALGVHTRTLGKGGALLWRLPDDLRRFKALTEGHPVIMGRKTWESLPEKFRPLPGRTNIVVTRQLSYEAPGAQIAASLSEARSRAAEAAGAKETFVIGGGELYTLALPEADRLYLTLVDDEAEGDAHFPAYEDRFRLESEETGEGAPPHRFTLWERK